MLPFCGDSALSLYNPAITQMIPLRLLGWVKDAPLARDIGAMRRTRTRAG